MASDLTVRFGGDTTGFNSSLTIARQALAQFSTNANVTKSALDALNSSMRQTKESNDGLLASLRDVAVTLASGIYVIKEAGSAYASYAEAVGRAEYSVAKFAAVSINSVLDSATGAIERYAVSSAYAERSSRLFEQAQSGLFAAIGRSIVGIQRFIQVQELAFTSTARTEIGAIAAAGGLDRFNEAISRMGAGAKETLDGFTAQLMQIPSTSREAAVSIEEMLATIPNYSTTSNDILVNLLQTISKTGDEAVANAKKITDAFRDQQRGGSILGDLTSNLKDLEDIQVLATRIASSLSPAQAQSYYSTLIDNLKGASAEQKFLVDQNVASLQKIPLVGNLMVHMIQDQIDKQREFAASVTVTTANLELQRTAAQRIAEAVEQQDRFEKLLNEDASRTTQLEQTNANIRLLQNRQTTDMADPGAGDLDRIARTLIGEGGNQGVAGMEAIASVIRNRAMSGYGGAQSYTDVINAPKQFSVWNPGDPAGAMANATPTDSPVYRQAMAIAQKMVAGNLDDPTGGATSYYNPSSASPSWARTMTNQTTIGSHVFGNTPGSPPVEENQDAVSQRLQEQIDLRKRLTDAQAGGTEAEREQLAIAQQTAAGMHDEVAQAQALLDAKKKDLAASQGGSLGAVRAAQQAVADAQIALDQKVAAADKATNDLAVARAQEGSRAKLDAQIAGFDAEIARATGNAARIAELEKQKLEATRAYNAQRAADDIATENASFDATSRTLKQEQDQIRENAQLEHITHGQEAAQLAESLTKQEEATRAHYAKIAAIQTQYAADTAQAVRKNELAAADAENRINEQRIANTRSINTAIEQSYRSSFEEVGQTVSSTLMQMIQRQATLRDLARSVALNIIQQFIQARVRMVADWAAGQAAQVAQTVSAEGAKTGATAAGTAARTSIVGAASLQQAAMVGVGVIKSILASAAETFAGIFGFLSPIMGPAAIGPAVAGQATVAAAASAARFDIGSWSLPSSGLAMVHAGEMIVPAAQTPWAQSLMAAAGGGGGGASYGDTHINVHNPRNFDDFVGQLRRNIPAVRRMLATERKG